MQSYKQKFNKKYKQSLNSSNSKANISKLNISLVHKGLLPSQSSSNSSSEPELVAESLILDGGETGLKNFSVIQGTKLTTARVTANNCLVKFIQLTFDSILTRHLIR